MDITFLIEHGLRLNNIWGWQDSKGYIDQIRREETKTKSTILLRPVSL